jgi:hypothetical protein
LSPRSADHHTALRSEVVTQASSRGLNFALARLQNSKEDISYTLHAETTSISFSGLSPENLFATIGFSQERCSFLPGRNCFATYVPEDFPLQAFADAVAESFSQLELAHRRLSHFGLLIPGRSPDTGGSWDGHASPSPGELKQAEDPNFRFVLSWVDGPGQKGFVFHYRPQHPPLSQELTAAFEFIELPSFSDCPYFDFEPCHWQFFPFRSDDRSLFDSNAQIVHETFAKLPSEFSPGLEALLKSHALVAPFGFPLLPVRQVAPETAVPAPPPAKSDSEAAQYDYDVAISFAGAQRPLAEVLATEVKGSGFVPFFDSFYAEQLWGKNLVEYFDEIYRKKSRYCVIFISREYAESMWTTHERKSAQARALEERGNEYILPIRIDDTELPGIQPTLGYLSISEYPIEKIAQLLIQKLKGA